MEVCDNEKFGGNTSRQACTEGEISQCVLTHLSIFGISFSNVDYTLSESSHIYALSSHLRRMNDVKNVERSSPEDNIPNRKSDYAHQKTHRN